jgi:hypothetical protein
MMIADEANQEIPCTLRNPKAHSHVHSFQWRFAVLTVQNVNMPVLWTVVPCSVADIDLTMVEAMVLRNVGQYLPDYMKTAMFPLLHST